MARCKSLWSWLLCAVATFCAVNVYAAHIQAPQTAAALLDQAEQLQLTDHLKFVGLLHTLDGLQSTLSPHDLWRLRYLQGWENKFEGHAALAVTELQDVADHADEIDLRDKADAILLYSLKALNRYREAFAVADNLLRDLHDNRGASARFGALTQIAQLLRDAGQYDLALDYLQQALLIPPPAGNRCRVETMMLTVKYESANLTSSNSAITEAERDCRSTHEEIYTDVLVELDALLLERERRPVDALAILQARLPMLVADQFRSAAITADEIFANAYLQRGDLKQAKAYALKVFALRGNELPESDESLRGATETLAKVAGLSGDEASALKYARIHEAEDAAYKSGVKERSMAFEVARHDLLVHDAKLERLDQTNKVLKLQRQLDVKAKANSWIDIVLLTMLAFLLLGWGLYIRRQRRLYKRLSEHDGLTGTYNHKAFLEKGRAVLRRCRSRNTLAFLVLMDLDHFKQVNDTYGHAMGDEVLVRAVMLCRQQLPVQAMLGRFGGEEYGILLTECTREKAITMAEAIRASFASQGHSKNETLVRFTASFGVAGADYHGYLLEDLVKQADLALYRAKKQGRNCVVSDMSEALVSVE